VSNAARGPAGAWRAGATRYARAAVARAAGALADFALPRHCLACGGAVEHGRADVCCAACWAALPRLGEPQCWRCGHPLVVGDLPPPHDPGPRRCRWCDLLPPYVRAGRSVCWAPEGVGGTVVRALKYDGWTVAAGPMARRMAGLAWPDDVVRERAALVPVPLAAARLRERGYNQSGVLAAALADAAASDAPLPVWNDVLLRTRATRSQTRLTPAERLTNVAGAFRAAPSAAGRLRGAHVVLVDDVVTTAATLNACAAALVAGGARVVSFVTFGRARA
jgi:ComF family protein